MNPLDNMMTNIVEEGEETIFIGIDMILDPIQRYKERDLFYQAYKKLKSNAIPRPLDNFIHWTLSNAELIKKEGK